MTTPREHFLQTIIDSAIDYAIVSLDLDGLVTSWNEGAHRLLGWTSEEMIGRPASVFFTLEDRQAGIPQAEMTAAVKHGRGSDERWHQKRDGSRFWANGEMMKLQDADGTMLGFIKILRDRTPQRVAAERQHADAEFLRSVLASSADCIKVLDLDARLTFMSEGGQRVMEVGDFNDIKGCAWPDFWRDAGHEAALAAIETAKAGGTGRFQGPAPTMAGNPRWWDVQVTPILGTGGEPEKLLSVSRDITEVRRAAETQALLMQELAHRVKNTLQVVQAIARQTFRGDGTPAEMCTNFSARLLALSHAHDVLLQGSWTEASLRTLVERSSAVIGHAGGERIRFAGPDVTLGPRAALSFALVLHELGTNATKYGSLSVAGGHVSAAWAIHSGRFSFRWEEIGGPPVEAPARRGFGSRLIEGSFGGELGAAVNLAYPVSGAVLTLEAPLAKLQTA